MLGYANYITDPRIRKYVSSLENNAIETDLISLKEKNKQINERLSHGKIYYMCHKYRGDRILNYVFNTDCFDLQSLFQ